MAHGFFSALALAEEEPSTTPGALSLGSKGVGIRRGGRPKRLAGRRWMTRADQTAGIDGGDWQQTRVVSYNVLAKCYAKQKHFTSCKTEHLRWSERRVALLEVIDELEADILCLQEIDDYDKFWYKELSGRGYSGVYKKRNSDRKYDGCATFFRTDRFECVDSSGLEFDKHLSSGDLSPDFATHNVALITVLCPVGRPTGSFCIANAHLFWDPSYEELKISQARALVRAAEEMATSHGGAPIILAGDFNSVPESCVYSFMTCAAAFSSAYATVHKSNSTSPSSAPKTPPLQSALRGSDPPQLQVGAAATSSSSPASRLASASASRLASASASRLASASAAATHNEASSHQLHHAGGRPPPGAGGGRGGGGGSLIFTKLLNPQASAFCPQGAGGAGAGGGGGGRLGPQPSSPVVGPGPPPGSPGQVAGGGRKGQGAGEPAFTNYRDIFNGAIDYVFVRCVGGRRVEVQACLGMICEGEARREGGGLPSSRHPSDHLPIACDLAIC